MDFSTSTRLEQRRGTTTSIPSLPFTKELKRVSRKSEPPRKTSKIPPPPPRVSDNVLTLATAVLRLEKQRSNVRLLKLAKGMSKWKMHGVVADALASQRSERLVSSMLDGVDEAPDEPSSKRKWLKMGVSVMRWLINHTTNRNLRKSWQVWTSFVLMDRAANVEKTCQQKIAKVIAEHKDLREKYRELKKKHNQREVSLKDSVIKTNLIAVFEYKTRNTVRRRFEHWKQIVHGSIYDIYYQRRRQDLEVEMQHIRSQWELIREVEATNKHLKMLLLCALAFHQWKFRMIQIEVMTERGQWEYEKKVFYHEITSLKRILQLTAQQEVSLMKAASHRGADVAETLRTINARLLAIQEKRAAEKR